MWVAGSSEWNYSHQLNSIERFRSCFLDRATIIYRKVESGRKGELIFGSAFNILIK